MKARRTAEEAGLNEPGAEVIDMRWLLRRKPTARLVKARVIVRQVRHGSDDLDTFAATATAAGVRVLLALLKVFKESLFRFGQPVLVRRPTATLQPKMEARWLPGERTASTLRADFQADCPPARDNRSHARGRPQLR